MAAKKAVGNFYTKEISLEESDSIYENSEDAQELKLQNFIEDSNKQLKVVSSWLKFFFIVFFFIGLSLSDFFYFTARVRYLEQAVDHERVIQRLRIKSHYLFSSLYQSLGEYNPQLSYDDEIRVDSYAKHFTFFENELINQFNNQNRPSSLANYETEFRSIVYSNLCNSYFSRVKGIRGTFLI